MYLGTLSGTLSGTSAYSAVNSIKGRGYKIWMSYNPATTPAKLFTDYIYKGKNTLRQFKDKWNSKYSHRFKITTTPTFNESSASIFFEGTSVNGETFGGLALDAAWARLTPLYAGASWLSWLTMGAYALFGTGKWRGIEQVVYERIVDKSTGRDAAEVESLSPPPPPLEEPNGSSGSSGAMGVATSYLTPILIGAGLLTATLITVALVSKKKKKVA